VIIERRGMDGGADTREAEIGASGHAWPGVLAPHHSHLNTRSAYCLSISVSDKLVPAGSTVAVWLCQACKGRPGFHPLPRISELELFPRPDPPDNLHDPESPASSSRGNQHEPGTAAGAGPSVHQAVGCP
jgi:hypothetical protein